MNLYLSESTDDKESRTYLKVTDNTITKENNVFESKSINQLILTFTTRVISNYDRYYICWSSRKNK